MKKNLLKMMILLLIVAMLTLACGSDSKKDTDKKKKKESSKTDRRNRGESNGDGGDGIYSPLTRSEFEDQVDAVYAASRASCSALEDEYTNLKTPGQEDDGFYDILNLSSAISDYSSAVFAAYYDQEWPDSSTDSPPNATTSKLSSLIDDLDKEAENAQDHIDGVVDSSVDNVQSSSQLEELHSTVRGFIEYINNAGFGPCSL
jgi:hypothetical protein